MANETYVAMTYQFLAHSAAYGYMTSRQTLDSILFNISVNSHPYMITLERGLILDGIPGLYGRVHNGFHVVYMPTTGYIGTEFVQGFCSSPDFPFPKFKTIDYDPSIVALFDPQFPSNPAPSASPSSGRNRSWIAIAVVIPIVAVVIVSVVLLVIFVPAVNHFFRPFAKRSLERGGSRLDSASSSASSVTSSPTSPPQNGWIKASKPE